jgi:hypothetical protein
MAEAVYARAYFSFAWGGLSSRNLDGPGEWLPLHYPAILKDLRLPYRPHPSKERAWRIMYIFIHTTEALSAIDHSSTLRGSDLTIRDIGVIFIKVKE